MHLHTHTSMCQTANWHVLELVLSVNSLVHMNIAQSVFMRTSRESPQLPRFTRYMPVTHMCRNLRGGGGDTMVPCILFHQVDACKPFCTVNRDGKIDWTEFQYASSMADVMQWLTVGLAPSCIGCGSL
jgi:hypothetical protein